MGNMGIGKIPRLEFGGNAGGNAGGGRVKDVNIFIRSDSMDKIE